MPVIRNIFIDTSIYKALNYQFAGSQLSLLMFLTRDNEAFLFTTFITCEEVKTHIIQDIDTAKQALIKFHSRSQILRNLTTSPFKEYFTEFEPELVVKQIRKQFNKFLKDTNAKTVPLKHASGKKVLERYFTKKAPFGEGKKKDEFPDAFVLSSLDNWCEKHNTKMYVASNDGDMESYCATSTNLTHISSVSDFLDSITSLNEELTSYIKQLLSDNEALISDTICDQFTWLGFWLEDEDGDVEDVSTNSIIYKKKSIIEAHEDNALVEIQATVCFNANITYDDLSTSFWDSEDKRLIVFDTKSEEVENEADINVELHISYSLQDPLNFKIESVRIEAEDGDNVPVRLP